MQDANARSRAPLTAAAPLPLAGTAAWRIAVVGAGPVGLALALHGARLLPQARFTIFDARPAERDVSADPRTLALALGSVMFLERLEAWPAAAAEDIAEVRVSQAPPGLAGWPGAAAWPEPEVVIRADELARPRLGAVLSYGALVSGLQQAVLQEAARPALQGRLELRLGSPVAALKAVPGGVEVDAGVAETYDLAVVAEGGVFAEQARKALVHDYGQTAWVGTATLADAPAGVAFERFTRQGPVALLPLPALPGPSQGPPGASADRAAATRRAALVWCVKSAEDPVRELSEAGRLALLRSVLPEAAGRLVALSPLKHFKLGLNAERTLVEGRTVRIGNAAQTLHPVAGQGLNLGLRDVHALVHALRHARDLDAALRGTEWARAPDRWGTILATDFLARSFTWQVPGLATLRSLGLMGLQALPPLKTALARRMMFGSL